jgi:hypothetical protein
LLNSSIALWRRLHLSASAQDNSRAVKAVQILGLPGVKENTKGTLEVENTDLHFVHGKQSVDVSASSIESVSRGANSQAAVGNTVSTLSMAAPYGSGRVLALLRMKINTLTTRHASLGTGHRWERSLLRSKFATTYDFAKKAAHVAHENFSTHAGR